MRTARCLPLVPVGVCLWSGGVYPSMHWGRHPLCACLGVGQCKRTITSNRCCHLVNKLTCTQQRRGNVQSLFVINDFTISLSNKNCSIRLINFHEKLSWTSIRSFLVIVFDSEFNRFLSDLLAIIAGSFRVSLFIDLGCPRDLGKGWGETLALLWKVGLFN